MIIAMHVKKILSVAALTLALLLLGGQAALAQDGTTSPTTTPAPTPPPTSPAPGVPSTGVGGSFETAAIFGVSALLALMGASYLYATRRKVALEKQK